MTQARLGVRTLVPLLGIAVLVLGGVILWLVVTGAPRPPGEAPIRMAERQIREQRGPDWEVRYVEDGDRPVLCGYAAPRSGAAAPVAFVSRRGRMLFADEPLPAEFRDLRQRYCPGFAQSPRPPA